MRECNQFPFMCDLEKCSSPCALDLLGKADKEDIELFYKDARTNGYVAFPVELALAMIQYKSPDVFVENAKAFSLSQLNKSKQVHPHKITSEVTSPKYHLRASEFNSKCTLSRILGKTNLNEENIYSKIGTLSHFLMNEQLPGLAHNKSLVKMGSYPLSRDEYCEKEIEFIHKDIVVRGHPDFMFEMGEILGVGDNKRSMHVKHTYFTQETIYALAEDPNRKNYMLVVLTRPFGEKFEAGRLPNMDVALIKKGGEVIRRTLEDIELSYEKQAQLLVSQNPFGSLDKRNCQKEINGEIMSCFDFNICGILNEIHHREKKTLIDILEDKDTEKIMQQKGFLKKNEKLLKQGFEFPQA